ncbi:cupin domain-containing protein [Govanella unica]|uniref:Cupin domain-containing protein n=1 Tax=Govanella unica TaxID=2975056 RepID=A0A9X3Z6M2_9PROT|nr:cupin domain-containing protein [Govania unica]MDA5193276.1 cupin domain-containing protein [Govania unica]
MSNSYRTEHASDSMRGRSRVTDTPDLHAYYRELEAVSATAFWKRANEIEPWEPITRYSPTLWRYDDLRPLVLRSAELVRPEEAGRRVVVLINDSDAGRQHTAAVGWLFSGLQIMKPGEITPAHRHTASAHRFIMEGGGAYTVVDGHEITLEGNDYVLTPNGCWHDHGVFADGQISIWQDGLDIPLMNALETNFYAVYPEERQTPLHARDDSPLSYGAGGMLPAYGPAWDKPYSPLQVYRWATTRDALYNLAKVSDGCPFDGHIMRYSNPVTGGWALKTLGAHMQMLKPGLHTRAHRHTGNVVYNVAEGEGYSIIGGQRIDWKKHDIFCVPAWTWHEHVNTHKGEQAFLFSFNDFPVMEALGLYMTEAYDSNSGYQSNNGSGS